MVLTSYDQRREQLLHIAASVFAAKGYHCTTMRELARTTGMSLAGMYHYVDGKDELLYLIQQRSFSRVIAGAERAIASCTYPAERIERFIFHHVTFFARHMNEMKVLSHEAGSLSEERIEGINALKRSYVDMLVGLLRQLDPPIEDVDPRVAAYALFGMMNWIYTWYDPSGEVSPESLATQYTQLFLNGIKSQVPHGGL